MLFEFCTFSFMVLFWGLKRKKRRERGRGLNQGREKRT
jgi:hypothetical protein